MRRVATAGGGERRQNKLSTTTQFGKNSSGVGGVGTGYWGQFMPEKSKGNCSIKCLVVCSSTSICRGETAAVISQLDELDLGPG